MLQQLIFSREMSETSLAEVQVVVVFRDVADEAGKVFYPRVVLIPIEEINNYGWILKLCDVEWEATTTLVVEERKDVEVLAIPFRIGEPVKVIDGPFNNFSGIIQDINEEKMKLRVMVSIFGRKTPVELDFSQVEAEK